MKRLITVLIVAALAVPLVGCPSLPFKVEHLNKAERIQAKIGKTTKKIAKKLAEAEKLNGRLQLLDFQEARRCLDKAASTAAAQLCLAGLVMVPAPDEAPFTESDLTLEHFEPTPG